MKNLLIYFYLIVFGLFSTNILMAQGGGTCGAAAPFCTGTAYTYQNNTNTSSQAGPHYGCLTTRPNPAWYWMQIGTSGNIDIGIKQTTGINGTGSAIDVDFIMWGPFTTQLGGCSALTSGNTIDCSYSSSNTETANITGGVVGQYYLLLLTNYSNQSGYIQFSQTGGTGATNCNVVSGCTATVNNPGPFCAGSSITMSTSGQANATNYSWAGPNGFTQSGASLTNISIPNATPAMAGTYTLTITRSPGTPCILSTVVAVNNISAAFTTPNATQCLTGNSFSFNFTGTSGASNNWNFGGATANTSAATSPSGITYATPGTYVVTNVSTANGCSKTQSLSVLVNPMPAFTGVPTSASCGSSNGSIVINNSSASGTGPFTYANNGTGVSSPTITGLSAGTYNITLTNTYGCPLVLPVVVGSTSGPSDITLTPTNASCGSLNGSFTFASPVGGVAPYSYSFNNGPFTANSSITSLGAGTYSLTVKDGNSCTFTKAVSISSVSGPSNIIGNSTTAGCGLTNGTYNITSVTGGSAVYSFSVDGVSTSSLTTGLSSGTHAVSVLDGLGCSFATTFNIGGAVGPTGATVLTSNASCGSANGSATVSATVGGSAPYQYAFDGGVFSTNTIMPGLTAGQHTVTVKDAGGCTIPVIFNVANTGSPTASISNIINVSCFNGTNGSFTVTPSGGTGPNYTYTLTSNSSSNGIGVFSNLTAGNYNIIVKDQAGCVTTTSATITQPISLTITATSIPVKCFANATGTINVNGFGGSPTFSYNINGSSTYQTSTVFANQIANTFVMGIKDANGCTATQTVIVTEPPILKLIVATKNANCTSANGVASTTVTGGTPNYNYNWTNGGGGSAISNNVVAGNYVVTVTDANGCTVTNTAVIGLTPGGTAAITASTNITCNGLCNGSLTADMTLGGTAPFSYVWSQSGQTTATAINLCPLTYTCVITDFYGCTATAVGTLLAPTKLTAVINSTNVACYGEQTGVVSANGVGGAGGYTYLWSPIPSTLTTLTNIGVGNYNCTIKDANGCTINEGASVTQPSSITLTSTVTPANCNQANGSGTVTATGGTGAYSYTWSVGSNPNSNSQSGLLASTYTINVKDANNCNQPTFVTIANLAGPSIAIVSFSNVTCSGANNGMAISTGSGGTGTLSYAWSNGIATAPATNLAPGFYTVAVTDQQGCVASTSLTITEPFPLSLTIVPTQPKCNGALNGFGLSSAIGGSAPYLYSWNSGSQTSNSGPLGAGNYGLTTKDANNCVATATMALINPLVMVATITSTNVTCFGSCNGIASANNLNGVGAVSYFWTGGPSGIPSQTATGLCAGTYNLLATDQNNCTASNIVIITEPAPLTTNISVTGSVTCNAGTNGYATVVPNGGSGTYSYSWSGAAAANGNNSTVTNLPAGNYIVTVTDGHLCSTTATATIVEPTPFITNLVTANPKCNNACDGTATVNFSGGIGIPTFLWEPGLQSGNSVNNLCAGPQKVTITSNGTCTTVTTFTLTEPVALLATVTASNSNCGQQNGKACASVTGGTGLLTYLWNNGQTTLCNTNVLAGAYTFTVTDANSCKTQTIALINDIAGPIVSIANSNSITCFGGNNGSASASISGGVLPYNTIWSTNPSTTTTASNLTAGLYNVTVTDGAGCVGVNAVTINQPTQIVSAIASSTNVSCFGLTNGGATMLVNNGTPAYTYLWMPGGQSSSVLSSVTSNTYTCVATDLNGCKTSKSVVITQPQALALVSSSVTNISCFGSNDGAISINVNGGTYPYTNIWNPAQGNNSVISSLAQGAYSLTVTDANNCSFSSNFVIQEPIQLTSSYVSLPAVCGNTTGSATVTVQNGTPNPAAPFYNLSWNTSPVQTGSVAINMAGGTNYSCAITDAKGCTIFQPVTIATPAIPTITGFTVTKPSCKGLTNGQIELSYTGASPYTVTWSNPISQIITTIGNSQTVTGIAQGFYTAVLKDNNGCLANTQIPVQDPYQLVLVPSVNNKICYGQSTQISAGAQGGTFPYSFNWSPIAFVGAGPHTVNPTTSTAYNVFVTDFNNCVSLTKVINITVSPKLEVQGTYTTICHGDTLVLSSAITGGDPVSNNYTYNWAPGNTTNSTYTVIGNAPTTALTTTVALTVKDNCSLPDAEAIYTITVNPAPTGSITANPTSGCAPLTVTFTPLSNNPTTDTYQWFADNASIGAVHIFTAADTISVDLIVTNNVGCSKKFSKTNYITVFGLPKATFYADPAITSILDPNINFINTSQNATTYLWEFGDPAATNGTNNSAAVNPSHNYNFVGTYAVHLMATSMQGCIDIATINVEITPDFALYIPNSFTPDANGVNDVFFPVGVGIDEDSYRMDIYDRWGELIFTSNNFRKGWDGTVKGGKIGEQNVYVYKLMVKDTQGNKRPFVGHVTLLKKDN